MPILTPVYYCGVSMFRIFLPFVFTLEAYKLEEWNHFRIEAIGNNIKVWINGIPTCNLINDRHKKAYIAFKIHSMKKETTEDPSKEYFRNIRIITKSPEKYVKEIDIPS